VHFTYGRSTRTNKRHYLLVHRTRLTRREHLAAAEANAHEAGDNETRAARDLRPGVRNAPAEKHGVAAQ
jgi:hypothetical protein